MQGDTVEHDHVDATGQQQARYGVERIELDSPGNDFGQVPSDRWSRATHSPLTIQSSTPLKDASDRADRGSILNTGIDHSRKDRLSSVFAEITRLAELLAKSQHDGFDVARGAVGWTVGRCRLAAPFDPVQALSARTSHPSLNDRQTAAKCTCHFAHAATGTYPLDHLPAASLDPFR